MKNGYTTTLDVWPLSTRCWSAPGRVSQASAPEKMSKERSAVADPLEYRVQRQKSWGPQGDLELVTGFWHVGYTMRKFAQALKDDPGEVTVTLEVEIQAGILQEAVRILSYTAWDRS